MTRPGPGIIRQVAMIYLKSVLAGLLAVVVGCVSFVILGITGMIVYTFIHPFPEGASVGWDPISLVKQSPMLPIAFAILTFSIGFLWEHRRLTKRFQP